MQRPVPDELHAASSRDRGIATGNPIAACIYIHMRADLGSFFSFLHSRSLSRLVNLFTISRSRPNGKGSELPAGNSTGENLHQGTERRNVYGLNYVT